MSDLLAPYQARIAGVLGGFLELPHVPDQLKEAMRYAVFNGGKRVRPTLVYLVAEALGQPSQSVDRIAASIEMIHCYSLVHDDLPAMDDDDLRRGNPTVHIKFDEATAILAGDALQTLAFELIATDPDLPDATKVRLISLLTRASGAAGMVGGQMIDLQAETISISDEALENMHRRKTGDLIAACLQMAACACNADTRISESLANYGYALGLAFQVQDDILDYTGDTAKIGKPQGSDLENNKTTFISVYGLEAAKDKLEILRSEAIASLTSLSSTAEGLINLANFVANRDH